MMAIKFRNGQQISIHIFRRHVRLVLEDIIDAIDLILSLAAIRHRNDLLELLRIFLDDFSHERRLPGAGWPRNRV